MSLALPKTRATVTVPTAPTLEERQRHETTHTPFEPWCEECVAGRGRGHQHRRLFNEGIDPEGDEVIEFDYTYYKSSGDDTLNTVEVTEADTATVLTGVHRRTGFIETTVVIRQGAWPFATALMVRFGKMLRPLKGLQLKGDSEPALPSLLRTIEAGLQNLGIVANVRGTTTGSHQSIGGAERGHATIAGFARTFTATIKKKTGFVVNPRSRLFVWLIRYAKHITNAYHVRRSGTTAHLQCSTTR